MIPTVSSSLSIINAPCFGRRHHASISRTSITTPDFQATNMLDTWASQGIYQGRNHQPLLLTNESASSTIYDEPSTLASKFRNHQISSSNTKNVVWVSSLFKQLQTELHHVKKLISETKVVWENPRSNRVNERGRGGAEFGELLSDVECL